MPKFLNNINLEQANDLQFKTAAGVNAGKIEQDGNDLILTNAVGDVLLGDGNADVYIGDGINNVDILFEQSGSIKADDNASSVTLTLGSANTTLNVYNPQIGNGMNLTSTMTVGSGGTIDFTPDTGAFLTFDGQTILERRTLNGAITFGHDDSIIIAGGDTSNVLNTNISAGNEIVVIGAEGGLEVLAFPDNDTSWSNRERWVFQNDGKLLFGQAGDTNIYRGSANTLNTDDSFVVGSRLYITTRDTNTTSTTALVMNGTEVEQRTLGSAAFSSTGDFAAASHTHAASDITSGTFADARIALTNITQHTDPKYLRSNTDDTFGNAASILTIEGSVRSNNNGNTYGPNFNVSTINKSTNEYAYRVDRSGTVVGGIKIGGGGVFSGNVTIDSTSFTASNITQWNTAYNNSIVSAAVTGTTTKTLTLTQQDAGTVTATWTDETGSGVDGTGTANYIPKWSDSDTLTDSVIYDDGADVGIGTTSPNHKLHVSGNASVTNMYLATNIIHDGDTNTLIGFDTDTIKLTTAGSERLRVNSTGNVGIGTTGPLQKLHVSGNAYVDTRLSVGTQSAPWTTAVIAAEEQHTTGTISANDALLDLYNSWGSDTDEKGAILTFSDNYFDGTNYNRTTRAAIKGGTDSTGNTANGFLAFYTDSSSANSAEERMRITDAGDVGIGTTSPAAKLDVNGDIRLPLGSKLYINHSGENITSTINGDLELNSRTELRIKANTGANAGNSLELYTSNSERMRITSDGNVGIGTTSPGYKVDVNGGAGVALRLNSTADAQLMLNASNSWTGIGFDDGAASGTDYIWHNGENQTFALGGGGSNVSGKKLHVHGATTIGSGLASTAAPTNGLLVEGNVDIGSTSSTSNKSLKVLAGDSYIASIEALGGDQGTGKLYVGQASNYGGGIMYNGDDNPNLPQTSDVISFYRKTNDTEVEVFYYPHNSSVVTFTSDIVVNGGDITLGGTGRIQGIDTVSAGTDAANKTYVDNAVAGITDNNWYVTGATFSSGTLSITGNNAAVGASVSLDGRYALLSHTHDDRYYTETESDNRFVNVSGDTMTGDLVMGSNQVNFKTGGSVTQPNFFGVRSSADLDTRYTTSEGGWGYTTFESSSSNNPGGSLHNANGLLSFNTHTGDYAHQIAMTTNTAKLYFRTKNNSAWQGWQQVFTDNYHPNADTLTTARTLTIGDTGKTFNGSANVSWSLSEIGAAPTSHTHDDRYYTETEIGNFFSGTTAITGYSKTNWDSAYTYSQVGHLPLSGGTLSGDLTVNGGDIILGGTGRIQGIDTVSANTDAANKLYVDNAISGITDNNWYVTSVTFGTTTGDLVISGNNAAVGDTVNLDGRYLLTSGTAANSQLLDSLDSTQFLRSDAADTASGLITFTGGAKFGSGVTLTESTDRVDLLYINSSTSTWGGLQIGNTSNEFIFSLMGDGNIGGIYDDLNSDWIIQWDENSAVRLYHNASERLTTSSSGITVTGDLIVTGGDISLSGTGRIQGIDTVSAGTDAANKTYVDNAIAGVGGVDGTGTANYIPKWSDTDTLTDSIIYASSSYVGIGTATPGAVLNVFGGNAIIDYMTAGRGYGTGTTNTSFGYQVYGSASGSNIDNTVFGYRTLYSANGAVRNTAIGKEALRSLTSGDDNVAIGSQASYSLTTGASNVSIGAQAGFSQAGNSYNVHVGRGAGYGNLSSSCIAIGYQSLNASNSQSGHIAIGVQALQNQTTGAFNLAVGYSALEQNTSGIANLGVGYQALEANSTGGYNLAIGAFSLQNNTASYNYGIGYQSLQSLTTGQRNTAFGYRALRDSNSSFNTAIGFQAADDITSGNYNTAIGYDALTSFTTGGYNTAIGALAGGSNTTNTNSVYIGYNARGSANGNTNEVVIGYSALGNGSNSITFGNNSITKHIFQAGSVGINDTAPGSRLSVKDTSGTIAGFYGTSAGAAVRVEATGSVGSAALELESASTSFDNYIRSDRSVWISNLSGLGNYFKFEITSGDLHADGDVIAYSTTTSDARLKDNVAPIENAIDKVKAINGVEYTWNAGGRKGQKDIGVIAQNVEQVIPEIVREKKMDLIDGEVYKTVDYDKLTALLIEAIKEQQKQIDELKAQIDGTGK